MRFGRLALLGAASVLAMTLSAQSFAEDLVFGRSTPQSILDPHVSVGTNASAITADIFDRLVTFGIDFSIGPGLAESWEAIDDNNWRIHLREGVKFHDGTPFTSADIVYSLMRAKNAPAAGGGSVNVQMTGVTDVRAIDDFTVEVTTETPNPLLLNLIGGVYIVPAHLGDSVTTDDFNAGKTVIGTGPYKFVSWIPNEEVVMEANAEYWGPKPEFEKVTERFITDPAARVAALLSNQVDIIDAVPPADVKTLEASNGVELYTSPTTRMVYMYMDIGREVSPQITDLNGQPLTENPLQNHDVRVALSKMIDRTAITERIMSGQAAPASQPAFPGQGGYIEDYAPTPVDLDGAKALLAGAGYPNGFGLTINCSTDRDINTPQVAQALAQFFTRGGIKVNAVDCQPYSVNAAGAEELKYSLNLWGRSDAATDITNNLKNGFVTNNTEKALGGFNRGRYSDPALDQAYDVAAREFDLEKRAQLLSEAAKIAMDDVAVIPLYFLTTTWAARDGITFDANPNPSNEIRYVHLAGN